MSMIESMQTQTHRRPRPLSPAQERLFFAALIALAAVVQIGAVCMTVLGR